MKPTWTDAHSLLLEANPVTADGIDRAAMLVHVSAEDIPALREILEVWEGPVVHQRKPHGWVRLTLSGRARLVRTDDITWLEALTDGTTQVHFRNHFQCTVDETVDEIEGLL